MTKIIIRTLILGCFIFISSVCYGDETDIFTVKGKTDVLIILDLSGSMLADTSGMYYCTDGKCARKDIAREAIKSILDDNGDGTIDQNDEDSLGVRIGYMQFATTPVLRKEIGSSYSDIWSSVLADTTPFPVGATALVTAMDNAKTYLDSRKSQNSGTSCFQQFVIVITDGQDTKICLGSGTGPKFNQYKRRIASVAKAKELADAGYKVFVIGFGHAMTPEEYNTSNWGYYVDMNTLNWMAYYGGTDNPNQPNVGNTGAITPAADPCADQTTVTNDPFTAPLSGYAYYAESIDQLKTALKATMGTIAAAKYSFSQTSVAATRVQDQNYMFLPTFVPSGSDPFWRGSLTRYSINSNGGISTTPDWEAGDLLSRKQASNRNILTYVGGSWTKFAPPPDGPGWGTWRSYLGGVGTNTAKAIVGYIQGDPAYNPDNWELGDTIHSNPVSIGSPSSYFIDVHSPDAFSTFRETHKTREKIVVVGANDGQFRAFSTSNGDEKWSFIPPNLLPKLQYLAHSSNSGTLSAHMYFVDGPVSGADVWLGTGNGTSKSPSDWKTLLVFSEGRGVRDNTDTQASYLWSSSQYCDGGFNYKYDSTHPHYCGYWAFDVTDTSATTPAFKWVVNPSATQAPYLDEPWSKMALGRVNINGNEQWVGFIGAGYNNDGDPNRGKGFFVVDLSNGNILWSFTRGGSDTATTSASMTYSLPASPAIVDTDNDGFVDTAYIGDLGGNIWRFKFCTGADGTGCGTSNWSGGKLFQSSTPKPIFTTPSAGRGAGSELWVFWGTGNKENPTATTTHDSFFAVKDSDRTSTYTLGQLQNIAGSVFSGASPGWYLDLATGEKVLADPATFGGMVTWTTYTPPGSGSSCSTSGTDQLYALAMMPVVISGVTYSVGAGLLDPFTGTILTGGASGRSSYLGTGIAQVPIYSQKPGGSGATDAYIIASGGGGQDFSIITSAGMADTAFKRRLQMTAPSSQVLHWLDPRMH